MLTSLAVTTGNKPVFSQTIIVLMTLLVAAQPLSAMADTHLLHQSGVAHSPLDVLHNNSGAPDHRHTEHPFTHTNMSAELVTIQNEVVLDGSATTVDASNASETTECRPCGHTHTTSSAILASTAPVTSLASKQQNLHFYLSPQSFEHRASPYRPPRP